MADVLALTVQIVSTHVAKNQLGADALPSLIQTVYHSLASAGEIKAPLVTQEPAVSWKKSVFPAYIVCLEDGNKLKMLKRYLRTNYSMTPDEYRTKWSLPRDYPMVAPDYAARRSVIAKKIGLGRKAVIAEPAVKVIPARRAKGPKG